MSEETQKNVFTIMDEEIAALQARRARSKQIDSYTSSEGACTICGAGVEVNVYIMRDENGTWYDRRREGCNH